MIFAFYLFQRKTGALSGVYVLDDYATDNDVYRLIVRAQSVRDSGEDMKSPCGCYGHTLILPIEAGKPIPSEVYEP